MSSYGLVVEDGSGVAGANGYCDIDVVATYADSHGLTFGGSPSQLGEQAIVRATASIDAIYGTRFTGWRTNGRDQNLAWPRSDAFDAEGISIDSDEIPQEVINATCEFAVRELAEAGSTNPDLARGGAIKRLKAGSVEIEYGGNAIAATVFNVVDGILAPLLGGAAGNQYTANAVRA